MRYSNNGFRFGPWSRPRDDEPEPPSIWPVLLMAGLTLALMAAYALVLAGEVKAQRPDSRLVELVAKVTFNEALDSYDDAALIWQIVEARGDTAPERARWLASHSPCVSGRLTQDEAYRRPGNCAWTRNLHPDGRRPRGWVRERYGHWSRMRPRWLEHLERVRALVRGLDPYRPCAVAPESWDGARWQARALAHGWSPVECQGSALNVGYVRASGDGA